jgi:nucleotide-binding universal stress UspA family protein
MRAQRLVVGLDGSDGSDRAVTWLAEVARGESLHVDAVHVLTYSHEFVLDLTPATMTTWRKDLEQDLRTTWVQPLEQAGFSVAAHIVEADGVAAGLAHEAQRRRADLVVIGSCDHPHLFSGMSSALSHRCPCPIVVVPRERDDSADLAASTIR